MVDRYDNPLGGLNIRQIRIGPPRGVLLAAVHIPGKPGWEEGDQAEAASRLAKQIASVEDKYGCKDTILVGDLNMEPFHRGVCSAYGFHGVMTKEIASKEARTVQGERCPFFYNPMWAHFGDRTPGPPGTFYFSSAQPGARFWHMLDQVLLRPSLMEKLKQLEILTSDGSTSLMNKRGIPEASDHLPVFFELDL